MAKLKVFGGRVQQERSHVLGYVGTDKLNVVVNILIHRRQALKNKSHVVVQRTIPINYLIEPEIGMLREEFEAFFRVWYTANELQQIVGVMLQRMADWKGSNAKHSPLPSLKRVILKEHVFGNSVDKNSSTLMGSQWRAQGNAEKIVLRGLSE